MFIHNIDPVLLSIFGLEIRYYGIVYVLGFVLGILWLQWHREELQLTSDEVYDLAFYLMLGVVVGGRLFHVLFWQPAYYLAEPWRVFFLWEGGMAYHGGLVGIILVGLWYAKKKNIAFFRGADILAVPTMIALALGRVANFINAELVGRVTDVSWCFDFGDGECRHPSQLYAAGMRFFVTGVLLGIQKSRQRFRDGFVFWIMIFLMGLGRVIVDFYREDVLYFGLSIGQWMSLVMVIVGGVVLIKRHKRDLRKLFKGPLPQSAA